MIITLSLCILSHHISNPSRSLLVMSDVVFGTEKSNLSLYPEGLALIAAFPNNASHCVADVCLSCVRARKSEISDEVEEEMQEELKSDYVEKAFLLTDGQLFDSLVHHFLRGNFLSFSSEKFWILVFPQSHRDFFLFPVSVSCKLVCGCVNALCSKEGCVCVCMCVRAS